MAGLHACSACGCHVRSGTLTCPHCGAARAPGARTPTLAAALLGLALVGCPTPAKDTGDTARDTASGDTDTDTDGDTDVDADTDVDTDTHTDTGAIAMYGVAMTDDDHDGYDVSVDCNDSDPNVHPGAPETAGDGVDSNCNGADDT